MTSIPVLLCFKLSAFLSSCKELYCHFYLCLIKAIGTVPEAFKELG
ncbi:MAG: hypothetical protein N3A55_05115 [Methylohalobius sp.]|nr:hypothetical protein [Methylohalobius sp.]